MCLGTKIQILCVLEKHEDEAGHLAELDKTVS